VSTVGSPHAGEKLPSGHVRCPNCAKMLPQAFINSHLDSCLTGNKASSGSIWGNGFSKGSAAVAAAQLNGVRSSGGGGGNTLSSGNGAYSGSLASGAGRGRGSGQLKVCGCKVSAHLGCGVVRYNAQSCARSATSAQHSFCMQSGMERSSAPKDGVEQVPPKLCVALLSDKAMRDTCKGFGLPATGRKEVRPSHTSLLAASARWRYLYLRIRRFQAYQLQ
jgi:hypothetical protein